jgi:hypothetical protein
VSSSDFHSLRVVSRDLFENGVMGRPRSPSLKEVPMNPSYPSSILPFTRRGSGPGCGTFVVTNGDTGRAEAQEQEICLDCPQDYSDTFGVPPTGSIWREIVPSFHKERHQTGFVDDDGDGVVSVGDYIFLDGTRFRVTSDGSAVYLDCSGLSKRRTASPRWGSPKSRGTRYTRVWAPAWATAGVARQWGRRR